MDPSKGPPTQERYNYCFRKPDYDPLAQIWERVDKDSKVLAPKTPTPQELEWMKELAKEPGYNSATYFERVKKW